LTRDPDVRYSTGSNPTAIGKFSIAVNDGYGDKKRTSYISIVVFGKQAENCQRYLFKGSKVAVRGHIQTGSYEKDGRKVYTTDVVADQVEFLKTETVEQPVQQNELPPQVPEGFNAVQEDFPL
jgi:single-strand DNA-binding protein